ncbi:hypothetical protein Avbf_01111 [Armadillidium vulgare]|nr:hypothetical protein Avbf_01111 [Armadillidium vulgare]
METMKRNVDFLDKLSHQLHKAKTELQVGSRRVAEYVKEKIEVFRQYVPILQCICNPGLRERHWKLLGENLGTPIELTESTSLGDMIEAGLPSVQRKLEEISHSASKEFALEKSLKR